MPAIQADDKLMHGKPVPLLFQQLADWRLKPSSRLLGVSALFTLCVMSVLLCSGCCLVPGGRVTDWWHNGCKVGPNYTRPAAPVASNWIDNANPQVKSQGQPLCDWWKVFNDPTLDRLIQTAYQQNLTIRTAGPNT